MSRGTMQRSAIGNRSELIALRKGRARVEIAADVGGSIASYSWSDDARWHHWLRPASAHALSRGDAFGMGCFPLVPYSNRVRNGIFAFEGRTVALPSIREFDPHFEHGHGWRRPWS